jgi:hypothetical protein
MIVSSIGGPECLRQKEASAPDIGLRVHQPLLCNSLFPQEHRLKINTLVFRGPYTSTK